MTRRGVPTLGRLGGNIAAAVYGPARRRTILQPELLLKHLRGDEDVEQAVETYLAKREETKKRKRDEGHQASMANLEKSNKRQGIVDENAAMLVMDNLEGDRVKGTKEWTRQNIVVDIPPESVTILIGAMITGDGDIWLDDLRFEEVSTTVELTASSEPIVTNDPCSRPPGVFPVPTNLSFEHPA